MLGQNNYCTIQCKCDQMAHTLIPEITLKKKRRRVLDVSFGANLLGTNLFQELRYDTLHGVDPERSTLGHVFSSFSTGSCRKKLGYELAESIIFEFSGNQKNPSHNSPFEP